MSQTTPAPAAAAPLSRRAAPLPPDERRAALVAAALPLILEHGTRVSTREIALAAGVAEGTIFRAFPDKASLIEATVHAAFDPGPLLAELRKVDPAMPLRPKLLAITRVVQERLRRVIGLMSALELRHPPESDEGHGDSRRATSQRVLETVAGLLEPDANQLRMAPLEVARFLRLLAFSGTHPRITDGNPLTADEIVAVLLDGVRRHDAPPTESDPSC